MSNSMYQKTPLIAGFAGENINLPELALPPNVSPNALNTDYYRKTMLKRAGFLRMEDRPQTHGGISARVAATSMILGDIDFAPAASFAFSFALYVDSTSSQSVSGGEILRCGTPGSSGFKLTWEGTLYRLTFETSGGTKTLDVTAPADEIVGVMLIYFVGASTKQYYLYINTTSDSETPASDTYSAPGGSPDIRFLYNGGSAHTMKVWLDELRWWDLSTLNDSTFATWLTGWTTDLNYKRQLTAAEYGDSKLNKYWRLNQDEFNLTNGDFTPTKGSGDFQIPIPALGVGLRTREVCMGRSLVSMPYDESRPFSTGLFQHNDQWFQLGAEAWQYDAEDAALATQSTRWSEINQALFSGSITGRQWSWCRFRNRIVAVHPQVGCYHIQDGTQFHTLVPETPSVAAPIVAADKGSGTGPGAGTYSFKFYYKNNTTGVTGLSSTSPVTVTMTTGNAIELSGLTSALTTRKAITGVDRLLVFRTKNGGSVYYLVDELTLADSPSDTESGADINQLDSALSELNTDVALGYILAELYPFRARCCFTLRGRIALWGVDEAGTYNATDLQNNVLYVSEALTTNLYSADRRYEVEPDEHDYAIGGIAVPGGALLAKRYSLCSLSGAEPSSYVFDTFSREFGCLSHNTISDSDKAIYLLSDYGIVAVSKGLNDAVNVTQEAFKPLFDDLDPSSLDVSCGIFWKAKGQYWCSFNTVTDGRITLVYNERTGAISKYDLPIESFYIHQPDGAAPQLYGTWRGYRCRLDVGDRDGGDVDDNVVDIEGTVTAATSETLTDSGQSWRHPLSYFQSAYADVFSLLNGHTISVVNQTTGAIQTRTILWNNATKIWVSSPWDTTPTAGDTYYIGGIDWYWHTPKLSLEGDRSGEEKFKRLYGWLNRSQTVPITLSYQVDTKTARTKTIAGDTRFFDELIEDKGRETTLGFINRKPDAPVEIEAFQIGFEEGKVR